MINILIKEFDFEIANLYRENTLFACINRLFIYFYFLIYNSCCENNTKYPFCNQFY